MTKPRGFLKPLIQTLALSGKDSQEARESAIDRLEQENPMGALDCIITVDIINEDCELLGNTISFKTNAANFIDGRICFKFQ